MKYRSKKEVVEQASKKGISRKMNLLILWVICMKISKLIPVGHLQKIAIIIKECRVERVNNYIKMQPTIINMLLGPNVLSVLL